MLDASRTRILESVSGGARVLDVGGWAKPLARADWVIDLMPYETRGLYGERDSDPERFGLESWVERDICDRQPWPFADDQFDFAVCSHTLEDVRDPIRVCAELNRVARAGYIEVPSRLEEQSWDVHGPWVGWSHHHWLVDVTPDGLDFVFKSHALAGQPHSTLSGELAAVLTEAERVQAFFWEEGFAFRERIFTDPAALDEYLREPVERNRGLLSRRLPRRSRLDRVRRVLSH